MDASKLRYSLEADYRRLLAVASPNLDAGVPSCPGWKVDDLVRHVAEVYMHKTECIRLGAAPEPWPPDLSATPTIASLESAYAALVGMFDEHSPADAAFTWHDPDQTVGFWIRRMAQETLVHRRDAELAAGTPTAAPADVATDGIAELLDLFVAYGTEKWTDEFSDALEAGEGDSLLVDTGTDGWLVQTNAAGVSVAHDPAERAAAVRLSADPSPLLFWLWNRHAPQDGEIAVEGDRAVLDRFRDVITIATQ